MAEGDTVHCPAERINARNMTTDWKENLRVSGPEQLWRWSN